MADAPGATGVFKVKASNGYSMLVIAFSRRADGRGEVTMFVARKGQGVIYFAPATVTPSVIQADLGRLGQIDLAFDPSGVIKREHPVCDKSSARFEAGSYRGRFEFHGEEGYAEASVPSVHALIKPLLNSVCGGAVGGETSGPRTPGARLRLFSHESGRKLSIQVNENRPGARVKFSASIAERQGKVRITRLIGGEAPSGAFSFERGLGMATLSPPAPFSGAATFDRNAGSANRWRGDLTVDFPGDSDVPLTGSAVRATLVHAQLID